jgi:hypothetical protein
MAASDTHIANLALLKLGESAILNLTEDSHKARELLRAYAAVRDAEFNRHRWRFTIERVALPALVATPIADYAYQYQLPGDFIRLIYGGDIKTTVDMNDYRGGHGAQYSIEGRKILTSLPAPLSIRYIRRITDTTLHSPAFDEAFASRLAYTCCFRITNSNTHLEACLRDYKVAIREATQAQALELASEAIADDTWVMARTR